MKNVKVIRLGQATQEFSVEDDATVASVLSLAGASAEGRTLTLNGRAVTPNSTVEEGNLLLAAQTKGGK